MPPERTRVASHTAEWQLAQGDLAEARDELAAVMPGTTVQSAYARLIDAQRRCTAVVHKWLAEALDIEAVANPRMVLSLDVDGVLEDETEGFSATGLPGAAALRLLQLGGVAVLLNTGRNLLDVQERVDQFALLGGIASYGGFVWDNVYRRGFSLTSARSGQQLSQLSEVLGALRDFVQDSSHEASLRVSRIVDGSLTPITGPDSRALLDRYGFTDLAFWVAPRHTDFVDRRVDKATGLASLREELGLSSMSLAAIGDGACDLPTLRRADSAFLPAATLPSYAPRRRQRLFRSRYLGDRALWDTAHRLVPDVSLRRRVHMAVEELVFPDWFPPGLRHKPPAWASLRFPRLPFSRFSVSRWTSHSKGRT